MSSARIDDITRLIFDESKEEDEEEEDEVNAFNTDNSYISKAVLPLVLPLELVLILISAFP